MRTRVIDKQKDKQKARSAWAMRLECAVFLIAIGFSIPAVGEDSINAHFRLLNYKFSVDREVNSAHANTTSTDSLTPVLRTLAADVSVNSKSMVLPEKRVSAVNEILRTHEFSIGAPALRAFSGAEAGSRSGLDFKAIKLRTSRSKVMLRADFTFR